MPRCINIFPPSLSSLVISEHLLYLLVQCARAGYPRTPNPHPSWCLALETPSHGHLSQSPLPSHLPLTNSQAESTLFLTHPEAWGCCQFRSTRQRPPGETGLVLHQALPWAEPWTLATTGEEAGAGTGEGNLAGGPVMCPVLCRLLDMCSWCDAHSSRGRWALSSVCPWRQWSSQTLSNLATGLIWKHILLTVNYPSPGRPDQTRSAEAWAWRELLVPLPPASGLWGLF